MSSGVIFGSWILPDEGAKVLLEIMKARSQARTENEYKDLVKPSEFQGAALRDKLKEWLQKALELVKEFSPESYSGSISIPFIGSTGFSWKLQGAE